MGINFKENQARLEQAAKIAQDLERVLKEQEHLISGAKAAASHAKESQVLLELAKLPIDRLKDATEETVRVETLRKYGFENVASIYNSSAIQLERIPGITLPRTPNVARERTIVGAFDFLPARELIPTSENERTVPRTAARVACQKEIPKPRKKEPYERANRETFAPHHGQKSDEAFPPRSLSSMTFVPLSSRFIALL